MISLINPNADVEVVRKLDISTPPLGLGYLASCLRERGFRVEIIDDLVERLSFDQILKRIKNSLIVGITSTTPTFNAALRYAKKIKEAFPNIFVIMGGVHATFKPYDALKYADAVCIGEGEETIVEVTERVESGKSLEGIRGIIYKERDKIFVNSPRKFIENLDMIPFPAYDLMPLDKYTVFEGRLEHFPVMTSRGCPFGCRYCSSSLFMGRKFRARSPKNVVDEIEWLINDFGAKHIAFADDTFTLSKRRVLAICDEIKKRGLEIDWSCSSRVDTINEEVLRKMKESGCSAIYFGVESASPAVLEYYKKKIDLNKVEKAVKLAKKVGIVTICSFIIGAPFEKKEDMKKTLEFALKLDPDYAQFSILTPYPGTEIYQEAKKKGLLLTENYDEYTAGKPVLKNFYMSPREISKFLRFCYVRFYLRPRFLLREIKKGNLKVVLGVIKRVLKSSKKI
uniref:Radical SAM protein n=1 Tax=Geoglobus ahangari TaxID=113653 RepID=A0A7C4WDV8_9EURY